MKYSGFASSVSYFPILIMIFVAQVVHFHPQTKNIGFATPGLHFSPYPKLFEPLIFFLLNAKPLDH